MRQSRSEVYERQPLAAGSQQRLIKFYIAVFLTTKVVFLFLLAHQARFVMDEFKQGGQPFFISKGFYENIFPVKTVLYAYFYQIAHLLSSNSFQIMLISRFQTALLGCITLYFFYISSPGTLVGKGSNRYSFSVWRLLSRLSWRGSSESDRSHWH